MLDLFRLPSVFSILLLLFLVGCAANQSIVSNVEEREANEIVVYLASKGIAAQKVAAPTEVGGTASNLFSITVASEQATDAMSYLNRIGLPRAPGTTLLTLFAKSGLMSSDREELIRYQAGLAEELRSTILKIDGIIDANVQISFPPSEAAAATASPTTSKITAAVYIKHLGIIEDPNMHLETKIKRLVSGSINGLAFDDVSVIADRARMAEIQLSKEGEVLGTRTLQDNYVSIWSIVMTKSSLTRFRLLFFALILLNLIFAFALGWVIYKCYPVLLKKKLPELSPPPEE